MAVGAGTVEWRDSKVVPLGSGFFHPSPHCSQKNGITRPLYRRREQAGSGSDEGCRELGWGYLNHVFIQICGIAAGEGAPVPLVPYRPKEEISGLTASRWVFAHKRLDSGFVVKCHLSGVHEDVEATSYKTNEKRKGVPNEL